VIAGYWARACVDEERCLVYGPRLGRLYLLSTADSHAEPMQRVLGLHRFTHDDGLADPADRVLHDRSSLSRFEPRPAPRRFRLFYRLLHHSRRVAPLALMARLVTAAGRRGAGRDQIDLTDIARTIHAVEQDTGLADCYPRALLTLYLCLRTGRACQLSIGSLAPTRMMHAWCSTEGQLPYEAMPEHYMYRPVLMLRFSPRPA
jgi:hypothetical protein